MRLLNIPHNALVFVGDGRKALFLRNDGNPLHPSLKMEQVHEDENPPTREQGTDRPGRLNSPMGQRTAVEAADWHHLEQHRFARRVAGAMEQLVRERDVKALVVVAPRERWPICAKPFMPTSRRASSPRSTRISPGIRSTRSRSI
ncbi:hypothetical protein NK6_2188 [Bradyrhizobium diazoefficiens]|uniref:Host attachment protein n=1 Tax=Bradyrhizobium diazoefficiens TaxID=1355477 RepID=A0A0E4BMN5_9BRAD|nr:hypothetical protein NK6_2188 [Bradyrhizobium diazoefficiens]